MRNEIRTDLGHLFDVDGVLTPTALVHEQAWKRLFEEALNAPFTPSDYLRYIDGKSRRSGVEALLRARNVPFDDDYVTTLAESKNDLFLRELADGVEPYPDALVVIDELTAAKAPLAVVSSSRNARTVLDSAGLSDRFAGWVDGQVALEQDLIGKPAPDMFAHAASLLGLPTQRCVVIEDAEAGVKAGAAGDFALVIGVDRYGDGAALLAAGADIVVADLTEILASPIYASAGRPDRPVGRHEQEASDAE